MPKWINCRALTAEGKPCKNKAKTHKNNLCNTHAKKLIARERKVFSAQERRNIIKTYGSVCYLCQREINLRTLWHIDHVVPFSKGGSDDMENLRPTHKVCNELKGSKSIKLVRLNAAWDKRNQNAENYS
jgi:5-methylcytosine-specific restriction endonuclease McrA